MKKTKWFGCGTNMDRNGGDGHHLPYYFSGVLVDDDSRRRRYVYRSSVNDMSAWRRIEEPGKRVKMVYVPGGFWCDCDPNTVSRPDEVRSVWDAGDGVADRFTVVLDVPMYPGVCDEYSSLGLSSCPDRPDGCSMYGAAREGANLGVEIPWEALPKNVAEHTVQRLAGD